MFETTIKDYFIAMNLIKGLAINPYCKASLTLFWFILRACILLNCLFLASSVKRFKQLWKPICSWSLILICLWYLQFTNSQSINSGHPLSFLTMNFQRSGQLLLKLGHFGVTAISFMNNWPFNVHVKVLLGQSGSHRVLNWFIRNHVHYQRFGFFDVFSQLQARVFY